MNIRANKIEMNLLNLPAEILYGIVVPDCLLETIKVCKQFNSDYKSLITLDSRCDPIADKHKLLADIIKRENIHLLRICLQDARLDWGKVNLLIFNSIHFVSGEFFQLIIESPTFTDKLKDRLDIKKIISSCLFRDDLDKFKYILGKWNNINIDQVFLDCFTWICRSKPDKFSKRIYIYLFKRAYNSHI